MLIALSHASKVVTELTAQLDKEPWCCNATLSELQLEAAEAI